MDDLLKEFLVEATEHIDAASMELLRFEKEQADSALIASLFRHIHTIKGSSGFLSLPRVGRLAHATETLIGRLRDGAVATPAHVSLILAAVDRLSALLIDIGATEVEPPGDDADLLQALEAGARQLKPGAPPMRPAMPPTPIEIAAAEAQAAEAGLHPLISNPSHLATMPEHIHAPGARANETVRVSVGVLDRLMGIVSELVLTRNQLLEISGAVGDETVTASVQNLSSVTGDLQDAVMRVRMQPVERLFATLPRLVRDLAIDLGKKIELVTYGAETELDRQVIELIRAPLTHIIRNAADHGLESVAERLAAGKPEAGLIRVSATYDAGQITIEVKDDGRGLDLAGIKSKAIAGGLVTPDVLSRMADVDIFQFVLLPGFSTATSITKVSGRGVGMDVVRENIQSIGGTVTLNSKAGRGTTVTLRIPLTLAIAPALILSSGGSRFAIPQMAVVEVVGVGEGFDHKIQYIHDAPVLQLRGDTLPLAHLGSALELAVDQPDNSRSGFAVILRVGGVRFGLLVETIADVQEVVIEPLVGPLTRIGVFSGQTILGDGAVVLILDPAAIVERVGLDIFAESHTSIAPESEQPQREKTRLVLVRAGEGSLKAVPLSLVMRIEEIDTAHFTPCDGSYVMLHEGRLLPILSASSGIVVTKPHYPILILAGAGQAVGLLVEEIIDVAEERLDFQARSDEPSVIGRINLHDRVVDVLDVAHFIERANPAVVMRGVNQRPRILLVDDKQFFRDMLSPVLLAAGYEIMTSCSGREALELFERGTKIHAVVTDIDMPEMDGYAFTRALLSAPGLETLPVIALAPQTTANIREAARLCGVKVVVGKFDRSGLLAALEDVLKGVSASDDEIEKRLMAEWAA